jgi:hypothetical protein
VWTTSAPTVGMCSAARTNESRSYVDESTLYFYCGLIIFVYEMLSYEGMHLRVVTRLACTGFDIFDHYVVTVSRPFHSVETLAT